MRPPTPIIAADYVVVESDLWRPSASSQRYSAATLREGGGGTVARRQRLILPSQSGVHK